MTKAEARRDFDRSEDLFEHCWRKAKVYEKANAESITIEQLDWFAGRAVNNERSKFYITG